MGGIILVGGYGKGGVGKTTITRSAMEYARLQEAAITLIDADTAVGDVRRVFKDALELSLSDDRHHYNEPDVIFNQALHSLVLVNLPASRDKILDDWIAETDLLALSKSKGIGIWYWFITDGCYASIRLLEKSLARFDHQIPHVLIRNRGRLNGVDFSYLDQEALYQTIVNAPNLKQIVDFPVLGSAEQFFIDKHDLTIADAQALRADENLLGAQRIKTFHDEVNTFFTKLGFNEKLTKTGIVSTNGAKRRVKSGNGDTNGSSKTTPIATETPDLEQTASESTANKA